MGDRLELLSEALIDRHPDLVIEVLAASSRLGIPLGWHYVLDLVWLLRELDLPAGATVLDAGAGWGLAQFLFADRGYRVISSDMSPRTPRAEIRHLYNFVALGGGAAIHHDYLARRRPGIADSWRAALATPLGELPRKLLRRLGLGTGTALAPRPPVRGPTITLHHAALDRLDGIADHSIDAVISVSALEHNPPVAIPPIVAELERVLRPGGPLLVTTSAGAENGAFHAPSHSHLLNEAGLIAAYGLDAPRSNFSEYATIERALRAPRHLERWLAWTYDERPVSGMPGRVWAPAYLPVAIRKDSRGRT